MRKVASVSKPGGFEPVSPGAGRPSRSFLTPLDLLYLLAAIVLLPWWLVLLVLRPQFRAGFLERTGFLDIEAPLARSVWLHGSSAGEIDLLRPLVAEIEAHDPGLEIVISAFAISGYAAARKAYPQHRVIYFPADFSPVIRRFLSFLNPCLVVLVESEFWPNFIATVKDSGIPVCVVNGKISEKSFRVHKRTRLVPWALRKVSILAVQTEQHAERFRDLGVPAAAIHVTGNMKYDLTDNSDARELRRRLRDQYGLGDEVPVCIGGSVHAGEYEALAWAQAKLLADGYPLRLVLVPRYPAEAEKVAQAVREFGLEPIRKSEIGEEERVALDHPRRVLVVDTMGELKSFYALSDIAYVGGSLTFRGSNKGGHNLMEPAILGVAPMFGPFNYSFQETVNDLLEQRAGLLVHNQEDICENLRQLLDNPGSAAALGSKARHVILNSRGATSKVFGLLEKHLCAG